jgi:hypothetical protein
LGFVHVPKEKFMMPDYSATPGIFFGYNLSTMQYFISDPLDKMLHRTRDVVFREGEAYTHRMRLTKRSGMSTSSEIF